MDPAFLQFGALGIVAVVVVRLVKWLTDSLNGKLDRLADAVRANTLSNNEMGAAMRQLSRTLENHLTATRRQ